MDVFLAHNSSSDLIDFIRGQENNILARFPNDIGDEIRGIAEVTKIEIALLIIYNIAYELVGLCTSIVAQNETGHVFHVKYVFTFFCFFGIFFFLEIISQIRTWAHTTNHA